MVVRITICEFLSFSSIEGLTYAIVQEKIQMYQRSFTVFSMHFPLQEVFAVMGVKVYKVVICLLSIDL